MDAMITVMLTHIHNGTQHNASIVFVYAPCAEGDWQAVWTIRGKQVESVVDEPYAASKRMHDEWVREIGSTR